MAAPGFISKWMNAFAPAIQKLRDAVESMSQKGKLEKELKQYQALAAKTPHESCFTCIITGWANVAYSRTKWRKQRSRRLWTSPASTSILYNA